MNLLEALPLNRECTLNDVINRVKHKTGTSITRGGAIKMLTEARRNGLVETGKFKSDSHVAFYRRVK